MVVVVLCNRRGVVFGWMLAPLLLEVVGTHHLAFDVGGCHGGINHSCWTFGRARDLQQKIQRWCAGRPIGGHGS